MARGDSSKPTEAAAGAAAVPARGLARGLGLRGALALNLIDMIGVGPFITIPLIIHAMHGPQAMLGWVLGALLAMCENLGFCAMGDGGRLSDEGVIAMDGQLPVSPSGGVVSTNPVGATAMIRVAEAASQVMGQAGEHQIPDVNLALATGYGGNAWTDMMVLGSERPRR